MVAPQHAGLSSTRQCRLVSITRSSFYDASRGDSPLNLRLMRRIDEQCLETPFYGSRQMTRWLRRQGNTVSRKRVRRLMRLLGVHACWGELRNPAGAQVGDDGTGGVRGAKERHRRPFFPPTRGRRA